MKKILPILLFVIVAGGALFLVFRSKSPSSTPTTTQQASNEQKAGEQSQAENANGTKPAIAQNAGEEDSEQGAQEDARTASEIYSTAEQALDAVKKAAADYDDLVLEQFTKPGPDCTWCDKFYSSIKDLIAAKDTPQEAKGYYAELLAVSGRSDNLETLVNAIKGASSQEEGDLFAEALELATGGDDAVKFLGSQMDSTNPIVQEASIAAVTNQGTRLAAELLYNQTVKSGNSDGYYSRGIGLGEFIPDPDALPFLQETMKKQDQYSHLAAKALVNAGIDGLRIVFDELSNIKDPEVRKKTLADLGDHVNYEEGVETYLQKYSETSQQPDVVEFTKKVLSDFKNSGDENDTAPAVEESPDATEGQN